MPQLVKERPRAYMGIDPGLKGGFALIMGEHVFTDPFPSTLIGVYVIFKSYQQMCEDNGYQLVCCLELVRSRPLQGSQSVFTFGKGLGHIEMALSIAQISWEEETPAKWMKTFKMKKEKGETQTTWKKRLVSKALSIFPTLPVFNKGLQSEKYAVADALLIAEHLRRKYVWGTESSSQSKNKKSIKKTTKKESE